VPDDTPADILDTIVTAETPEGILLELRPAGLPARCYAFLIDLVVRAVIIYAFEMAATAAGGMGIGLTFILIFVLEWFYPVLFELSRWGATPGKRSLGLRVVMDNGLPITPAASLTRNLLRVADFMPLFYAFGVVSILVRRDSKRLGDLAAATLVVYQPKPTARIPVGEIAPLAPAIALAPRDQAAVIALAARATRLTAARVDELAALAAPVSGDTGQAGPHITRRVLGVAQWYLGRRN
jgi:uncharacterized RDD family membrane protein YckC